MVKPSVKYTLVAVVVGLLVVYIVFGQSYGIEHLTQREKDQKIAMLQAKVADSQAKWDRFMTQGFNEANAYLNTQVTRELNRLRDLKRQLEAARSTTVSPPAQPPAQSPARPLAQPPAQPPAQPTTPPPSTPPPQNVTIQYMEPRQSSYGQRPVIMPILDRSTETESSDDSVNFFGNLGTTEIVLIIIGLIAVFISVVGLSVWGFNKLTAPAPYGARRR
jgi:hypothetical protein